MRSSPLGVLLYIRGRMRKMSPLIVLLLCVSAVCSDSHSLSYYTFGVSAPGYGLPEYSILGYLDDQLMEKYTSDTLSRVPMTQWMKDNEKQEYWERWTHFSKGDEALFRHEVKLWRKIFNHTGDFHFVQVMTSCELRDDGSTIGYKQYRYDGEEFMYFDTTTGTFIPTMAEARIITQKWNRPDLRMREVTKIYMENECTERLKRFIEYRKEDLEKRVRPQVKVSGQEKGDTIKLHCQVYGFHPRPVDVKWMNGEDEVHSYETTNVLPNPDGTYQIRVSVEVTPKDGDSYSCYVDHSSLEEPLLTKWESPRPFLPAVIISAVVSIILIFAFIIAGVIIYRNIKNYTAAGTSDTSSHSDKPA
ncbi:major histocompatibility complex class I-related gene protein-like isoform X2 [Dendrobates tinctorius]|uniref:major histocompatibility complex class I-related gene protein-like isoform X2 n=1 Tax=Dendrobates tinctorius TaxID=92724 RepID=UPI003CC95EBA